ncbi:MAG: hypothetical protein ACFFED_16620 [Candidatus Thorarchaeota archaeon]
MSYDALVIDPDQESAVIRLEHMGRYVTSRNRGNFEEALRRLSPAGIVDITNWSRDAIHALLCFLHEVKRSISLKNGFRYFTPIIFPEGPLLDALVDAIVTGDL